MSTNVNKIIENAVGQVRNILADAVKQVDEKAREDLIAQFNKTVGGSKITTVKARPTTKRKTSAKKKTTKKASSKKTTNKKVAKSDKPKRKVSAETRAKLAANLAKAREAKAKKAKATAKTTKKK